MQALGSLWKGKQGRLGDLTARPLSARPEFWKSGSSSRVPPWSSTWRPWSSIPGSLLLLWYLRNGFVKAPACLESPSWLSPGDEVSPWGWRRRRRRRVWCCGVTCSGAPCSPWGCFVLPWLQQGLLPMTVLPLPINDGAHIPWALPLPHSTGGRHQRAGFCGGIFALLPKFLLASQHGGEGMFPPHTLSVISSAAQEFWLLYGQVMVCLSWGWLGFLQRCWRRSSRGGSDAAEPPCSPSFGGWSCTPVAVPVWEQ